VSALHITNGDCAASKLREFIVDPVTLAADVLHDGPAPDVSDEDWYTLRAGFLADTPDRAAEIRDQLASWDRRIEQTPPDEEIILWFEHDLFDQLNLIRALHRIGLRGREPLRASLICIDRFPGVKRFIGLGQLSAPQLQTLVDKRQPVTRSQIELASRAWSAFRAPDPAALLALVSERALSLPFLADALRRFLAEYPSTTSGLSTTRQYLLEALDQGPLEAGELFRRTQDREDRPFIGDWGFFDRIRSLTTTPVPLLRVDPESVARELGGHDVSLTAAGRAVVQRSADAIELNGIDEWHGGVHLRGSNRSPWRWDRARETLVSWQ
jgi:hypothetical protein